MFKLNELTPLVKKRKRVGRGGSRGGTSGRGHKGQRARSSGNADIGFEGGQMPLYRRLPKRGFNNTAFQDVIQIINLATLERVFENGTTVTKELMIEKGVISAHKSKRIFAIKILGKGELNKKLIVCAELFSASALVAIEKVGGEARIIKGS